MSCSDLKLKTLNSKLKKMNAIQFFDWGGNADNGIVTMDINVIYTRKEYRDILKYSILLYKNNSPHFKFFDKTEGENYLYNATAEEIRKNLPKLGDKILKEDLFTFNKKIQKNEIVEKMELFLGFFHSYDDFYRIVSESKAWINDKAYNTKAIYSSSYSRKGLSMMGLEINMGNTKIGNLPNHLNIKIQI